MELTKDEMLTLWVVLDAIENKMPYKDVREYISDITLDKAYELFKDIDYEINADKYEI